MEEEDVPEQIAVPSGGQPNLMRSSRAFSSADRRRPLSSYGSGSGSGGGGGNRRSGMWGGGDAYDTSEGGGYGGGDDMPIVVNMPGSSRGDTSSAAQNNRRETTHPLPTPAFPHSESVCDSFSPVSPKVSLWSAANVELPEELRAPMERQDALAEVFEQYPTLVPVKAKEGGGNKLGGNVNSVLSASAAALASRPVQSLGLSEEALQKLKELPADNPNATLFAGPIEVPTPATLRTLILQPAHSSSILSSSSSASSSSLSAVPAGLAIRLSGVALQHRAGRWSLMPGQTFHPALPSTSDRMEMVRLPPDVVAIYDHGQRRWYVVPERALRQRGDSVVGGGPVGSGGAGMGERQGGIIAGDTVTHPDPAMDAFIKAGGRRQIAVVLKAADEIVEYYR